MLKVRCRIVKIDPEGTEEDVDLLELGDSTSVTCGEENALVEVRDDGMVYVEDKLCAHTAPAEVNGYSIRPEAVYEAPEPREHPQGKICRYCVNWNAKQGKQRYYEEVPLTCETKCPMVKAITDTLCESLSLPTVDPNDLGYCTHTQGLEAGSAPACDSYRPISLPDRLLRVKERYLWRSEREAC